MNHAEEVESPDVVVIGAGAAGLSAAVELASAGAQVLLLEAFESPGGAAALSIGGCCAVGTKLQNENGIADSLELALSDWEHAGQGGADLDWARRYLSDSAEMVIDWLASMGVVWEVLNQEENNSVPRWHRPAGFGRRLVEVLLGRLAELGVVPQCGQRVETVTLEADGVVLQVRSAQGLRTIHAQQIVMTTGGFVSNREMLTDLYPEFDSILSGGAPNARGDGHRMLTELGAQFAPIDRVWMYPIGTRGPVDDEGKAGSGGNDQRGIAVRGQLHELWFNANGERFCDESLRGGGSGTPALLQQPGHTSWGLMDSEGIDKLVLLCDLRYWSADMAAGIRRTREVLPSFPHVVRGDSIAEVAAAAGLPPSNVVAAVERFNAAVAAGLANDPETGRPLAGEQPIVTAPFTLIQYFPLAQKCLGGVRTDADCAVLGFDGTPLPRVFAAGEVAGMSGGEINGLGALEGTMLGPSLYSGRLAGRAAAAALPARSGSF